MAIVKTNPLAWGCSHSDVFNGVRINCAAKPGESCKFVDALGNQRNSVLFHSERQDSAREMIIMDGSEPSEKDFMKALESINVV